MFHILHRRDQRKGAIAAVEFEGEPYGAGVSFFLGNLPPGKGPGLHQHPYAETCIVLAGQAAMVVDGERSWPAPVTSSSSGRQRRTALPPLVTNGSTWSACTPPTAP